MWFENIIFNLAVLIGIFKSSYDNVLRWMPQNLTDDKSTLVQIVAWCRQAPSHCLSQVDPDLCCHMASLGVNELKKSLGRSLAQERYKPLTSHQMSSVAFTWEFFLRNYPIIHINQVQVFRTKLKKLLVLIRILIQTLICKEMCNKQLLVLT